MKTGRCGDGLPRQTRVPGDDRVTDFLDGAEPEEKPGRKWIPKESYRQEKAVVFVRDAVIEPHIFLAYDRAQPRGDQSHLFQWRRGLRADTLDTELLTLGKSCRFEFKAPGQKVKDDDGQGLMIRTLISLGVHAWWGVTIADLCVFYRRCGVKLVANAEYRALVLDGLVDSRIAKAEAKAAGSAPPKPKRAPRKAPPGRLATVKQGFRLGVWRP